MMYCIEREDAKHLIFSATLPTYDTTPTLCLSDNENVVLVILQKINVNGNIKVSGNLF